MQREADDEAYLDELRGAEFEKAWNKRTEVWAREQDARERLMGHVMEERRRQIEDKMARSEAESMEEAQERQRLMEDIARWLGHQHTARATGWGAEGGGESSHSGLPKKKGMRVFWCLSTPRGVRSLKSALLPPPMMP